VAETGGGGVAPFPGVFRSIEADSAGIARMADAVGVNHVGIRGDPAGIVGAPPYRRFDQFPLLIEMLRSRGSGAEEVANIAGGNFMRLFDAVAQPAQDA